MRFFTSGLAVSAFIAGLAVAPVEAQQSGYSAWADPNAAAAAKAKLQDFTDKLNALVDAAEKARAADPQFLRDLRGLANSYNRPWRQTLLSDNFTDGDFTENPTWSVSSGKYWVERGWGLRSAIEPGNASTATGNAQPQSAEQAAAAMFGQILNQTLGGGRQRNDPPSNAVDAATIHSIAHISNAFSLDMTMSSWKAQGRFDIIVDPGKFQGPNSTGYRLSYAPGGGVELRRVSRRGDSIVERSAKPTPLEDKKNHELTWSRYDDGRMTVAIDGKTVFEAMDRGFRESFDGLALVNRGGDYIVKRISVEGKN